MIVSRASGSASVRESRENREERFEIQPVFESSLRAVANFIHRCRSRQVNEAAALRSRFLEDAVSIERRLKWLLLDNPDSTPELPLGYCVRDSWGVMRGINLCFPATFWTGDRRVKALCSGSFFVEPHARAMGFYLFKRYLVSPKHSFFFATTCNANSEPLWRMLGGRAVPDSEWEYILPLRLDAIIPAATCARTSNAIALKIARLAGRCANPILRFLTHRPAVLTIEACQDWEKLAALARRHRRADRLSCDRSPEFLEWRYGQSSPAHPCGVYVFRDRQGNEGWFAFSNLIHGDVQGPMLLDTVWPHEKVSFKRVFREIVRIAPRGSDAFFFRRQPGLDHREYCGWALPHKLDARAFVIEPEPAAMALDVLDYADNDYLAWMFHWANHGIR